MPSLWEADQDCGEEVGRCGEIWPSGSLVGVRTFFILVAWKIDRKWVNLPCISWLCMLHDFTLLGCFARTPRGFRVNFCSVDLDNCLGRVIFVPVTFS